MQAWVCTLRQKATGVVPVAGDALVRFIRRVRMAVVSDVAYGQTAVVENRDRGGFA
ncbi:C component of insecticidal toxin complex, partial [Salmonella enterica]|nr:C component of insecticidal toxin complex [Salmonella enterica]